MNTVGESPLSYLFFYILFSFEKTIDTAARNGVYSEIRFRKEFVFIHIRDACRKAPLREHELHPVNFQNR